MSRIRASYALNVTIRERQHDAFRVFDPDETVPTAAEPSISEVQTLVKGCLESAFALPVTVTATRTDR